MPNPKANSPSTSAKPTTPADASRIQSAVDRKGGDEGFKSRTSSAADANVKSGAVPPATAPKK